MRNFVYCVAILFGMTISTQAATINGHALRFERIVGDTLDSISPSPQNGNYTVGTPFQTIFGSRIRVGVSDNQVRVDWIGDTDFLNIYSYNGLKLSDAFGFVPDFLLFHQVNGFGVSNVTTAFDADTLIINFADSGEVLTGSSALFEFRLANNVPTVPLPASLPLLFVGICGLRVCRNRKSRSNERLKFSTQ